MAKMEFSKMSKDGSNFSLYDIAFALEVLAEGEASWHSTDDDEWNGLLEEAAMVLKLHQAHKEATRD